MEDDDDDDGKISADDADVRDDADMVGTAMTLDTGLLARQTDRQLT